MVIYKCKQKEEYIMTKKQLVKKYSEMIYSFDYEGIDELTLDLVFYDNNNIVVYRDLR